MIVKQIIYFGQPAKVGCDNNCRKAWGIDIRPCVFLTPEGKIHSVFLAGKNELRMPFEPEGMYPDYDNFAYIPDQMLAEAPQYPGTWEGSDGKPMVDEPAQPEKLNRWCVRQCERNSMSERGQLDQPLKMRDFSDWRFNMPSIRKKTELNPNWRSEFETAVRTAQANRPSID